MFTQGGRGRRIAVGVRGFGRAWLSFRATLRLISGMVCSPHISMSPLSKIRLKVPYSDPGPSICSPTHKE